MSNVKNGQVSWTETVFDATKRGKDMFLRLSPGSNIIRLLTPPHQYHQHRYEVEGGRKYGYRINCSRSETEDNCPLCEMDNKAKRRWFVGVVERKTGTYKVLDIGYSVFKSIQTLAKGQWGTPDKYDVDIVVDPNGGSTGYYYVSPMPPTPLTADDIRLQEENPVSFLEERSASPSPKEVQSFMDKIHEEIEASGKGGGSSKENSSDKDDDDDDDFFKNYDKKKAANS